MKELKEMLDKHEKILKDNNWIQAIIILSLFGKNMTIEELDAILTKLENGTLWNVKIGLNLIKQQGNT